ncbi:thiol reductant ABC exporter subunit CydD [Roseomonas aerophila]|uniref:Thiol reductant ABC exporter subunit CydD n=1 Tax=Teichococcus aerophilus TaxID=1224513 RepID=A0ABR7RKN0_9PROT|nr:thiol reductant ABC exporter subunit CydD [Pseudoroseomonas aerophila]MBC9206707.1 thiol reductant ABC exporter subunit CydD [Pseudoroseomonas aerophila]
MSAAALKLETRFPREMARIRQAGLLQAASGLVWIGQAALLAGTVHGMATGAPGSDAVLPAIGILVLALLRAGLDAAANRRGFLAARAIVSQLRRAAVDNLPRFSPFDRARPASGQVASVLAEQADALLPWLTRWHPARLRMAIVPTVILLVVLAQSWVAALALLIAAPLIPIFMALIGLRARDASDRQMAELGGMNGFLLDRLRGLDTLRAFGAVDATARQLRASAERLRRQTMAVLRIAFLSSAVLELFAALGVAMVATFIGLHLLGQLPFGAWGSNLTLASGLFMLLLAPEFFQPLRDFAAAYHDRAAGEAALAGLARLLEPPAAPILLGEAAPDAAASPIPMRLALAGIGFRYPGEARDVVAGFSLDVAPGEHVALLGPSGAGKSTLLALVAGLLVPHEGAVRLDGIPLDESSAAAARARMAWLGARPHLFAGSFHANLLLGRRFGQAELLAALDLASAGDVVARRPGGLKGGIGEGGLGLSGGEARRIALARAALNDAAGLILADEPTAHLDRQSAAAVAEGLLRLAKGRTLLVTTHDPALAARMDRVVRL